MPEFEATVRELEVEIGPLPVLDFASALRAEFDAGTAPEPVCSYFCAILPLGAVASAFTFLDGPVDRKFNDFATDALC